MAQKKPMSKKMQIRMLVDAGLLLALATFMSLIKIFEMPFGGSITLFSMLPIAIFAYRYGVVKTIPVSVVYGIIQMLLGIKNFSYVSGLGAYAVVFFFDYIIAFGVLALSGVFRKTKPDFAIASAGILSALEVLIFFITIRMAISRAKNAADITADFPLYRNLFIIACAVIIIFCAVGFIFKTKVHPSGIIIVSGIAVAGILRTICHFISGVTVWSGYAPEGVAAPLYSLYYNLSYMVPEIIVTAIGALIACTLLDFDAEIMNVRMKDPSKVKKLADIDLEDDETDK